MVALQTPWSLVTLARRLYGVLLDVTASSTRHQCSANAVKAQCMLCERLESIARAQGIATNAIERHATCSIVATPWSLLERRDMPLFTKKYQDFFAISRRSRNFKRLRANAMATRLGVTGALAKSVKSHICDVVAFFTCIGKWHFYLHR